MLLGWNVGLELSEGLPCCCCCVGGQRAAAGEGVAMKGSYRWPYLPVDASGESPSAALSCWQGSFLHSHRYILPHLTLLLLPAAPFTLHFTLLLQPLWTCRSLARCGLLLRALTAAPWP
jgi:hypothetical protein